MTPQEAVTELMMMRRKVVREMPHVNCTPFESPDETVILKCSCYKLSLNAALLRAEMSLRHSLGMPPF